MIKVRCICINDSKKPQQIPQEKWVVKDEKYTITHIYVMKNQKGIKGCELAEHDISDCEPYNCYRLNRFAIHEEDLGKLIELINFCDQYNELSDFDIQKYVDDLEVKNTVDVHGHNQEYHSNREWAKKIDPVQFERSEALRKSIISKK